METTYLQEPPRWVKAINSFNTYMTQDLLGGRKSIKIAWAINTHKILTPFIVFVLMLVYQNFSLAAWLYLALHGSYCVCWLIKHVTFRDPKWETKMTWSGAVFTFLLLATYWVAPYLLISGLFYSEIRVLPNWLMVLSIALVVIGTTLMMASDCQKMFVLKMKPGLIIDGLFSTIRHPNYLGEMMVYAGFAVVVGLLIPWLILAYWWIGVFLVNMHMIEASISRYPEWIDYKSRTGILLPKLIGRR